MSGNIVLATRFGPASLAPARVAAELADRLGGRLTVVYVASELGALAATGGEAGIDMSAERKRVVEAVTAELHAFVAEAFGTRDVDARVLAGDLPTQVAAVAGEVDASYVVVGMRGHGTLARLILGDTTHEILERVNRPTVVVPLADPA